MTPVSQETFFDAIDKGDIAALRGYLAEGYRLGACNAAGNNELGYSLVRKQFAVAEFLIGSNAALDQRFREGSTALHYATMFGFDDIAAKMIDRGAPFGADVQDKWGAYPLKNIRQKGNLKKSLLALWPRLGAEDKKDILLSLAECADLHRLRLLAEEGRADILTHRAAMAGRLTRQEHAQLRAYLEEKWKEAEINAALAKGPVKTAAALPRKPAIKF